MLRGYSFVMYNDVVLEITKLVSFKRQAVMDKAGLNYMYTRCTLVVRGILSQATSEHYLGPGRYRPDTGNLEPTVYDANAQVFPGERLPPAPDRLNPIGGLESDNAIRMALLVPRRRLYYVVGGDYLIDAPHGNTPCDVNFGPIPLFAHVEKIAGMGTTSILFGIQVDLNQCPMFTGMADAPKVLSHEYSQQVEVDERFLTRRTTRGEIKCRAEDIALATTYPDRFREYFSIAVPGHYKRDSIRVVAHPDMTTLEYAVVDVEKERPIVNYYDPEIQWELKDAGGNDIERMVSLKGPLSRVAALKVTHTVGGGREFTNLAQQSFGAVPVNPSNFLPDILFPGTWKDILNANKANLDTWIRDWLDRNRNRAIGTERVLMNLRYGTPVLEESIKIEVMGSPTSTRYELELIAWYVLMARMPVVANKVDGAFRDQFYAGGSISFKVTHDVMGNYVSMDFGYKRAAPEAFGIGAAITGMGDMRFGPMISGEQSIVGQEVIEGVTLHSYSKNHNANDLYNVPASRLPENEYNPWGRKGEFMHGADYSPVVVDSLHDACEAPHEHSEQLPDRESNLDSTGDPMPRQASTDPVMNLRPVTPQKSEGDA
jgi:hypothetical protein